MKCRVEVGGVWSDTHFVRMIIHVPLLPAVTALVAPVIHTAALSSADTRGLGMRASTYMHFPNFRFRFCHFREVHLPQVVGVQMRG